MPTAREIEQFLYQLAPSSEAMEWDNVGLLVGDPAQEVNRILVSLDITETVVDEAVSGGYPLIVAHHPVMNCRWNPVQSLRRDTPQGRLLMKLVEHQLSAICMHTNLDRAEDGVNNCLAALLGLTDTELLPGGDGVCRMGRLPEPLLLKDFVGRTAEALHCAGLRYADGGTEVVERVAVGGGACGEYAEAACQAGCDTFVTADCKYHGFLDAAAMGLNLVDAGHFPTEDPVCWKLISALKAAYPLITIRKSAAHKDVIQYMTVNR